MSAPQTSLALADRLFSSQAILEALGAQLALMVLESGIDEDVGGMLRRALRTQSETISEIGTVLMDARFAHEVESPPAPRAKKRGGSISSATATAAAGADVPLMHLGLSYTIISNGAEAGAALNDARLLLISALSVFEAIAESITSNSPDGQAYWGAVYLLRQGVAVQSLAERGAA